MRKQIFLTALLVCASGQAQRVSGPVAGYVPDAATTGLQPVLGIPGAAILGDAIPLKDSWSVVGISPAQDYFLATDRGSGVLLVIRAEDASAAALEGSLSGVESAQSSPNGTAAVLRAGTRIQIVTGLPDSPTAHSAVDVASMGAIAALAVADDGTLALAATESAFYSISSSGDLRWLGALSQPVRLSFANRSRSAAVAGVTTNELWILDDAAGDFSLRRLAGPDNGLSGPVGVAFADDNRTVLAAHSGGEIRVAVGDSSVANVACSCTPTVLARMRGTSTFRLTEVSDQPMWIFDGGASQVWFVPPRLISSQGGGQ
jgi:hypothetical protein